MPELIDRHALLKRVYEHPQERERMTDGEWCRKCIYEAPKVEADPVRRGRWIVNDRNPDYADCTNCGLSEWLGANGSRKYAKTLLSSFKKFCPNCGARMDLRTPTEVELDTVDSVMMGDADNG